MTDSLFPYTPLFRADAEALALGGGDHPFKQLGAVRIGVAVAIVVQIVEFANRGVARFQHLDIELRGDRPDLVQRQAVDETVHHLAPGPVAVVGAGRPRPTRPLRQARRSEAHTSERQSLMRISYSASCSKKQTTT